MRMNFAVPAMPSGEQANESTRNWVRLPGKSSGKAASTEAFAWFMVSGQVNWHTNWPCRVTWLSFGFDDNLDRVNKARKWLYSKGVYGSRVSVRYVENMDQLPVTGNIANLLVSESILTSKNYPG